MPFEHRMTRRVEFPETDLAGIVHFSNYFRYFESAEHDFFRSIGLSIHQGAHGHAAGEMHGFARFSAACDYLAPLCYDEVFRVRVVVAEIGPKSIKYAGTIHLDDEPEDARPRAVARWGVVRVSRAAGYARMRASEIPPEFASKLEAAPEHVLTAIDAHRHTR